MHENLQEFYIVHSGWETAIHQLIIIIMFNLNPQNKNQPFNGITT